MTQSFNFTNHDLTGMECNEYALLQEQSMDMKNSIDPMDATTQTVMKDQPRVLTP
eukprot:CAMPEP_0185589126 /NCGR_PEP_ID=MMETSP0434-20130131/55701_1 /TAXON_ID=626734 ORGANISM="Favella taraikaensis, Strain Fe Narragansett Bay" /NCGR_SAMPLE_ID=MMETSP0434 /ASSEMBLY_ACC=CAM_ASM_000379 /LENGTH=54 /DNA_ID=CAMNT_0028212259 /DNA_START=1152 /DNA_END=1316 /DNA_ORIENTATION=-